MINVKKLLGKILSQIQLLQRTSQTTPWAWKAWSCGTNQKTYNTVYYPSAFGGTNTGGYVSDPNLFAWGADGCTIYKPGYYFVTFNGHINCTVGMRARIHLYSNKTGNIDLYYYMTDGNRGYMTYSYGAIIKVGSPPEGICPGFLKYVNDTTSTFRPTLIYMTIIFLSDLHPNE